MNTKKLRELLSPLALKFFDEVAPKYKGKGVLSLKIEISHKGKTHADENHPDSLSNTYTLSAATEITHVIFTMEKDALLNAGPKGAQKTKDNARIKREKLRAGMVKYFADVEADPDLKCKLEDATADQLRKEYDRTKIAKGLIDDQRDYFETSEGAHDGECPYSESRLRDHEVRPALEQLILEKKIPPEPPPQRRRK